MKSIAIIGLGRIGRAILKKTIKETDIKFFSDMNPNISNHRYLLKYDSTYGRSDLNITNDEKSINVDGKEILFIHSNRIDEIHWDNQEVDLIFECSGFYENEKLIRGVAEEIGAKAIITKSSKYADKEIVFGLNHETITKEDKIFSSSICDANALSHLLSYFDSNYQISAGHFISLHPWLSYQNLVDGSVYSQESPNMPWKEFSLGRASSDSLIPKNTTAIEACEKILPSIKDKFTSFSYRTPLNTVTSGNLQVVVEDPPKLEQLLIDLKSSFNDGVLFKFVEEDLVSIDFKGTDYSCAIYAKSIKIVNNLITLSFWYDNEWGYAQRAVDLARYILKN